MIQVRKIVTSSKDFFPKCVDCINFIKHVENNKEYDDLGKCKRNGYFLPNTLVTVNFYALSCRKDERICGKNGQYFESNK
jgi:hypothetical protein